MLTLHFVPDRDYYSVIYRTIYRDRILKPFAFYSLAPVGFLLSMLAFGEVGLKGEKGFISGFFLAAVLVYFAWFIALTRQYKQHLDQMAAHYAGKSLRFDFDDAGVKFSYERGEASYLWKDFRKLERHEILWALYLSKPSSGALWLPADQMTDEVQTFVLSKLPQDS